MSGTAHELCFHCHEPLAGSKLIARVAGAERPVCCSGCQAVAAMIASSGLSDFYERRAVASPKPQDAKQTSEIWRAYVRPDVAAEFVRRSATTESIDLLIENLRCSACGWLIERTVGALEGVTSVEVNAALGRARIEWANNASRLEAVMRTIAQLGYHPHPLTAETTALVYRNERHVMLKRFVVATFGMMQVMMFAVAGYSAGMNGETIDPTLNHYFRLISLLVSIPVLFYAARPFLTNAWNGLRARTVGMDLPVSIALLLAFVASAWNTFMQRGEVYFDSITMFVFFLSLSRLIEFNVRHHTNSVVDALAQHSPATAQRIVGARVETVAVARLRRGDHVLVPSGATVPADGTLIDNVATLNESLLTGESMPVLRKVGEWIAGGSINTGSPVCIEVTATGAKTMLSSIVALVQRAQTRKPQAVQAADRAASLFLRVVLIASVGVCAAWLAFDPARAFEATLAVLVVACPCAFSIATPAALAASTARLARLGVLVAKPDAIEALAAVQRVIFDKTGTLTRGEVRLESCQPASALCESDCLALAAALERASEHPIAAAFKNVDAKGHVAIDIETVCGFGVEGTIAGRRYRIGMSAYVAELRGEKLARTDEHAGSVIVLGDECEALASFELSDALREDSRAAVDQLTALGISSEILSGDAHAAVAAIARRCNIPWYFARRTPTQKLGRIEELQVQGLRVAMIGDGINDAPVLGAADASVAMGRGSALAIAAGDFILVSERPSTLADAIRIARRTMTIARQNLVWSATYNFCALPLAAFGLISPWVAAIGMSVSSMFVLLNALRLLPPSSQRGTTGAPAATRLLNAAS